MKLIFMNYWTILLELTITIFFFFIYTNIILIHLGNGFISVYNWYLVDCIINYDNSNKKLKISPYIIGKLRFWNYRGYLVM
jgi:hypothetical protein